MISLVPPLARIPLSVLVMVFIPGCKYMSACFSDCYTMSLRGVEGCSIFSIHPSRSILHVFPPWPVSRTVYELHLWDLLSHLSMVSAGGRQWWEIWGRKESDIWVFFFPLLFPTSQLDCVSALPANSTSSYIACPIALPTDSGIQWLLSPLVYSGLGEVTALHCC